MIYSVFDWNSDPSTQGHYVYFEGPGEDLGIRPKARSVFSDDQGKGHKLEDMLPVVPVGSKPVGRGEEPRGRIAVLNDELRGELGDPATSNPVVEHPWLSVFGWGLTVFGGWYFARWLGKLVIGGAKPHRRRW